jgi:hypothetical protein
MEPQRIRRLGCYIKTRDERRKIRTAASFMRATARGACCIISKYVPKLL